MGLVKRRSRILMGGTALAVLAFSNVTYGQTVRRARNVDTPAPVSVISSEDLNETTSRGSTTLLQRIIVGAGNEKIAIDTPQSVTVINQDDLDREGATTIGETFDEVPGVTAIGSDRIMGQSFNIRGIGTLAASDESKIIISVDGATKFYEQYRVGSFFSDPELYKQIEVLRGPASSTLYGSGAYGGVINLTTKDASDFLDPEQNGVLRIKGAFDSNPNGYLGSAILALRIDESSDLLITGNYRQADQYVDGNGTPLAGADFESSSYLIKGTHRFGMNDEQVVRLSYQRWQNSEDDTRYEQTGTGNPLFGDFGTIDRDVTDETIVFTYVNPDSENDNIDFKFNLSYSNTETVQSDASSASPGGSLLFESGTYAYETISAKFENTFESSGDDYENFLTIGTQLSRQERTAITAVGGINFHPEGEDTRVGLYIQDEFIFDEKLTLIPGVRVDFITLDPASSVGAAANAQSRDETAFSPKLAALYKFNDTFSLFGSIAHTERTATLDELFSFSNSNILLTSYANGRVASPNLEKEESDNYEIGFTLSHFDVFTEGDGVQLKTTFFQNNLENLIVTNQDRTNAGPVPYHLNVDKAQIEGVEIEAAYNSETLFGSLAYSRIRGMDLTTNIGLDSIPADKLAFTIGTRVPEKNLEFGWKAQYFASIDTGATGGPFSLWPQFPPFPSYNIHGVYMSWKPDEPEYGGFEFRASVENMFDVQYHHNLSGEDGKGRTFKVSLVKEFGW